MGRHAKTVTSKCGIDRRESGYYSTPDFIVDYVTEELLKLNPKGDSVLDPCVGKEEFLKSFMDRGLSATSFDIQDFKSEYQSDFIKKDFLEYFAELVEQNIFQEFVSLDYDFIVANPPYNCHETDYIRQNKEKLKSLFGDIGVGNMYSMFVSAIIDCAKEGAFLGILTYDSFLTARTHEPLRKKILQECTIHHLLLCPSTLFREQNADVRTCIMILEKKKSKNYKIKILNRTTDTASFKDELRINGFPSIKIERCILNSESDRSEFLIDAPDEVVSLFREKRIRDYYDCITGISTGNDSKYLSSESKNGFSIPFYKNPGKRRFKSSPDAYLIDHFLEEDKVVKNFMVRNKECVGKEGISCSSMGVAFTACYLPLNSTFGVNSNIFTNNEEELWFLIGYLNSSLVTYIVRGMLLRSNMITSGYVSRIPIPMLDKRTKEEIASISKDEYNSKNEQDNSNIAISKIDQLLFDQLKFSGDTIKRIVQFCVNVVAST
jgi:N-6 DNA Methylase